MQKSGSATERERKGARLQRSKSTKEEEDRKWAGAQMGGSANKWKYKVKGAQRSGRAKEWECKEARQILKSPNKKENFAISRTARLRLLAVKNG